MAIATLTVDLVAKLGNMQTELNRASQIAEKNAKRMEEAFSAVKGTIGTLFAGVAVGSAWQALITDTAKLGAEISKLSQLSNTTVEDFQLMAYGAKSAGVEQDKLADILKDVNDKFGEFSITGGGELKDFFETVAKKVGVTAEAFKDLSGPQALQLYYDTLQRANVSQQQATFYMEALANDATLLIPLLKDGGAGFKQMADEAQRFGVVMDSQAIAAAKEFDANMKSLGSTMEGLKLTIGNAVIPTLNRLSEEFLIGMRNSNGFLDALRKYGLTNPFKSQAQSLKELSTEAGKLEDKISIGRGTDDDKRRFADLKQQIGYYKELDASRTKAMGGLLGLGDIDNVGKPAGGFTPDAKPEKTPKAKAAKLDRSDPFGDWLQDLDARVKPAEDALKRFRDIQLDAAVSGADLTASQRAFYDLVNSPEWAAMSEPWQDLIRAEAELASVAEQAAASQRRLNELLAATDSAQLEKTRADMQLLADALEAGRISAEQFEEAASKALGNVASTGKDQFQELMDAINGWGREASGEIARVVMDGSLSLKSLGSIFDTIAQKMVAMAVQQQIMDPLFKSVSGAGGSGFDFTKLMAMIPSFDVGTPYVPQTGLALIHKGERIIPARDNARGNFGGGGVTINFALNGPVDARTQQQTATLAGAAVRRALARNG